MSGIVTVFGAAQSGKSWPDIKLPPQTNKLVRCERYTQVRHLIENCDGYGGGVQGLNLGGVTVVRECASHQGGVKGIRKVCQFYEEV